MIIENTEAPVVEMYLNPITGVFEPVKVEEVFVTSEGDVAAPADVTVH